MVESVVGERVYSTMHAEPCTPISHTHTAMQCFDTVAHRRLAFSADRSSCVPRVADRLHSLNAWPIIYTLHIAAYPHNRRPKVNAITSGDDSVCDHIHVLYIYTSDLCGIYTCTSVCLYTLCVCAAMASEWTASQSVT